MEKINKVATAITKLTKNIAAQLTRSCGHIAYSKLKMIAVVTGTGWCVWSASLIINGFTAKDSMHVTWQRIRQPHYMGGYDATPSQAVPVGDSMYKRIQQFRIYMDSLFIADKRRYDSFMISRPHLMDSIRIIENFYQQQNH